MRLIAAILLLLLSFSGAGQTDVPIPTKLDHNTSLSDYFAEELKILSHDSMEGRGTLSRGIRRAESHIVKELRANGVDTCEGFPDYLQDVPLLQSSVPNSVEIQYGKKLLLKDNDILVVSGKTVNVMGNGVFVSLGLPNELENKDLKGKWVIAIVGNGEDSYPGKWLISGQEKARICRQKGALGLIEIFQPGKMPWQMLKSFQGRSKLKLADEGYDFPHMWVNPADSSILATLTSPDLPINVNIVGVESTVEVDHNIIGFIPGSNKSLEDEVMIFSAHYDHVGIGKPDAAGDSIYNGARDNAVGVATLLALSRHFAEKGTPRPLLFVFFTAEERGLLGSKYFVENCPVPLSDIRFNFNCDKGGYTDVDMISIVGFHRMEGWNDIDELLKVEGMRHYEPVSLAKRLFYASDNANFAEKGIPAPSFSMGFTGMTQELLKFYHQAGDHWDNFDRSYMSAYWKGISAIAVNLVGQEDLPYWKTTDPLYEKANQLYENANSKKK
mgnify:CR=1 FL=1